MIYLFNLFQILTLALLYSLLFCITDLYFIKWYRNLSKQDKKLTIVLKSVFIAITGYSAIIKEPYLIPTLILTTWLLFNSFMGLYLYNNLFKVGKNSVLDDIEDSIDQKDDQIAKLSWFIKLGLIVVSVGIYFIISFNKHN